MSLSRKKNNQQSDSELLKKFLQTGDSEWFGVLYDRYIHLVYGVCLKYLKNREESKDAVNQIFEKLMAEVSKFDIQNFRSWLYVVVKNHCMMKQRRYKMEKKQFEQFSQTYYMESTVISHPIDEEREDFVEEQLLRCLEQLKEAQQNCIRMFYYEKKCYREICRALNVEQKKVKSLIQNGKRNLKNCLEQHLKEDEI